MKTKKQHKAKRDFSFLRYFNSPEPNIYRNKHNGIVCFTGGTYVKAIHGLLSTKKLKTPFRY